MQAYADKHIKIAVEGQQLTGCVFVRQHGCRKLGAAGNFLGSCIILGPLHGQKNDPGAKFADNLVRNLRHHLLVVAPVFPLPD
ncbi:hypothetical protein SDC9_105484 [bioreactor metagenome]|uniref:Uncharacterized protein n=1 Tax=bioreactor metagenome TaxID=1076179 RepID=A0A645AZN0_9ZZZZ